MKTNVVEKHDIYCHGDRVIFYKKKQPLVAIKYENGVNVVVFNNNEIGNELFKKIASDLVFETAKYNVKVVGGKT